MARHLQQYLKISQIPIAVLAMDTIGHLPITSKGNRWTLTAICLHTSYVLTVSMKEKSAENVVQAFWSGILAQKLESVAILSDNGTESKNKVLSEVYGQLGVKRLFSNPFHPLGNAKVENVHNFVKGTLTNFLDNSNLKWDEFLSFACFCHNVFSGSNGTESPFFLMFGHDPAEGHLSHHHNHNRYYGTNEGKIVFEELHKLWEHKIKHLKDMHQRNEHTDQKLARIILSLKLGSQSWSRTMYITSPNLSIYWTTEY